MGRAGVSLTRAILSRMSRRTLALVFAFALAILGTAHAASGPNGTKTAISTADQARIDAAKKAYGLFEIQLNAGATTVDTVYLWSRRWYDAERDAGVKTAGADHFARMTKLKTLVAANVSSGTASSAETASVDYYVAEATLWK